MRTQTTKKLVMCALFAALTAVFAQIAVPIGPVPINFAILVSFLAGGLLGAKYGSISQLVYLLLGAVGVPVFAGFTGGLGILVGKTGGYIVGFAVAALLTGIIASKSKLNQKIALPIAMVIGLIACYALGTAWFMFVTKMGLWQSLIYCVFPFIIGDVIKIVIATALTIPLKKALKFA